MDLLSVGENQIVTSLLPVYYNSTYSTLEDVIRTIILEKEIEKHPIGSLEFNTSGTNPSTYLGFGTWSLWGSGRVPVGVDPNDTDYDAAEKTGGNKTVDLSHYHSTGDFTLKESHIPSHSHTFSGTVSGGEHSHSYTVRYTYDYSHGHYNATNQLAEGADKASGTYTATWGGGGHSHSYSGTTSAYGGNQPHNHGNTGNSLGDTDIRQPYITCYMWKRTA